MLADPYTIDLGPLRSAFDLAPIGIAMLCPTGDGSDFRYGYVNPAMQALAPATPMLGRTYGELHEAGSLSRLHEVFDSGVPWVQPEAAWPVAGAEASGRWFRIESSLVDIDSKPCLFNAATEVTAEVETRHALEQQAESERATTALLLRAADLLSQTVDLDSALRGLLTVMIEATGRHRVLVSLYDADHGELVTRMAEGASALEPGHRVRIDSLPPTVRRSLAERRSVVVDYTSEPVSEETRRGYERYGLRLALSVPLVLGDALVGHVLVDEPDGCEPFTEREIELVEGIAAPAAATIENARLFDAERLRSERMARLKALTDIATSSLEPAEVAQRSLRYFSEELGVDVTTLWAIDDDRQRLYPLTGIGFPPEFFEGFARGVGLDDPYEVATAYREGRPVVRGPGEIDLVPEPVRSAYARFGVSLGSLLVLPVGGGSASPVGAVTLAWQEPHSLDEEEVRFFTSAVNTLAIATENARLYEERDRAARTSELLASISYLFMTQPVEEALQTAMERASALLGAVGAVIARRERGGWRTTHRHGPSAQGLDDYYTDEQSPARMKMLETLAAVVVPDVLSTPEADPELAARLGYRSYIAHPLLFGDRIIGALTFFFAEPRNGYSDAHEYFTTRVIYIISAAMENARLFEAERQRTRYAQALNSINDALHSTLDFDEIMGRVVVDLTRALDVDASAVHMRDGGHWGFRYSYGLPEGLRVARLDDEQARISTRARQSRQTIVVNDVLNDPRTNRELMDRFAIHALIAVPLVVRDDVLGILFVGCIGRTYSFSPEQVDFAEKTAAALSLALENARLYQSEHRIAETLQEALISLPDTIGGLSFAHTYRSAAEVARVGGDFYDMFEMADGAVGIMIGDVAGKGLDAAVLTSLVKNAVRAHALGPGRSPGRVLQLTNDLVVRSTPVEAFVTVFFGVLDCDSGCLTYSNAGHTAGAIVREEGELLSLPAQSPLLGAFPDVEFVESVEPLDVDASLFLYTDGVIEARCDQEFFGEERLFDVLRSVRDTSPQKLVDVSLAAVREFTGDRLTDDLAILAVKRLRV